MAARTNLAKRSENLAAMARELERRRRNQERALKPSDANELDWREWNALIAPAFTKHDYAPHHETFWDLVDQIPESGIQQQTRPIMALWPRGHGKSSAAELAVVKLGAVGKRRYALYVSGTQDLADDHVANCAGILESDAIEQHYPAMADRALGKHGNSKGWRRNRVRTASGFTIDAIGLDTAARGVKLEDQRPDVIILDDIDSEHDTPATVNKKIRTLSYALLQAGSDDVVVLLAQNLIHPNSIAKKLADQSIDMLADGHRIGPMPAVEGMQVAQDDDGVWRITDGKPTWQGMDLEACEARIRRSGLDAFVTESQQQIEERAGALWDRDMIEAQRVGNHPLLERIIVCVDPNKTGKRDDAGIIIMGLGWPDGAVHPHVYILEDRTLLQSPEQYRNDAADAYLKWGAGSFVVERTGLGDHAELTLRDAPALRGTPVTVEGVEARVSKQERARPVAQLYRDGRVHHVGVFPVLESQQTSWVPTATGVSPGAVDALVHGVTKLLIDTTPIVDDEWSNVELMLS